MKVIKVVSSIMRNAVNLVLWRGNKRTIFTGYDSAVEARNNRTLANQFVDAEEYEVVDTRQVNRGTLSSRSMKK